MDKVSDPVRVEQGRGVDDYYTGDESGPLAYKGHERELQFHIRMAVSPSYHKRSEDGYAANGIALILS